MQTDARVPVAPNQVHFLFWGGKRDLDRQQACSLKDDTITVKYNDGVAAKSEVHCYHKQDVQICLSVLGYLKNIHIP